MFFRTSVKYASIVSGPLRPSVRTTGLVCAGRSKTRPSSSVTSRIRRPNRSRRFSNSCRASAIWCFTSARKCSAWSRTWSIPASTSALPQPLSPATVHTRSREQTLRTYRVYPRWISLCLTPDALLQIRARVLARRLCDAFVGNAAVLLVRDLRALLPQFVRQLIGEQRDDRAVAGALGDHHGRPDLQVLRVALVRRGEQRRDVDVLAQDAGGREAAPRVRSVHVAQALLVHARVK